MNLSIENRNSAFANIVDALPQKRAKIFKLILENEPCTIQQLCRVSSLPINEISGRITELKMACVIVELGKRENAKTNHGNTIYKVANMFERRNLLINRKLQLLKDKKELLKHVQFGVSGIVAKLIQKQLSKVIREIKILNKVQIV